ncbi:MAG: ABC transporter substrate-binding protein, partial [Anaerolineales bacterium]
YGEVTAEDVKFSYERFKDEALAAPYAGDWAPLDSVEVTGTYTGKIILKESFAPLWTTTLPLGSGYVLSKKALEEKGAEKFGLDPIGTGPYEFVEWKPKEIITLKKFADFNPETIKDMGPATLEWDEIHIFPIVEDSAAAVALEAGDVDFGRVEPGDFDRFQADANYTTQAVSGIDYEWLNVNIASPKLKDIKVRQAIRYALDVPTIIEAAHEGKWQRACAMVAPGQVGHWAEAPCYERDVDKAKQLLSEAGVSNLELNLTTNQSEPFQAGAQVVQAQLAEVGITVNIETVDDATYNDIGGHVKARDLTFVSYSTNPDPSWSTVWFLCDQVDQWNWTYYCNEELDALNAQAAKEPDAQKRSELYVQVQQMWDEAAVFNWIAYRSFFYVSRADLNVPIQPNGRWIAWAVTTK